LYYLSERAVGRDLRYLVVCLLSLLRQHQMLLLFHRRLAVGNGSRTLLAMLDLLMVRVWAQKHGVASWMVAAWGRCPAG
jgi:hypothetical protein